jgi:hypothetical protein
VNSSESNVFTMSLTISSKIRFDFQIFHETFNLRILSSNSTLNNLPTRLNFPKHSLTKFLQTSNHHLPSSIQSSPKVQFNHNLFETSKCHRCLTQALRSSPASTASKKYTAYRSPINSSFLLNPFQECHENPLHIKHGYHRNSYK